MVRAIQCLLGNRHITTTMRNFHLSNSLGRYTHRVALSNDRILPLHDGQVTFCLTRCPACLQGTMVVVADLPRTLPPWDSSWDPPAPAIPEALPARAHGEVRFHPHLPPNSAPSTGLFQHHQAGAGFNPLCTGAASRLLGALLSPPAALYNPHSPQYTSTQRFSSTSVIPDAAAGPGLLALCARHQG